MLSKTIKLSFVLLCFLSLAFPSNVESAASGISTFANAAECPDTNQDGHADVTDNRDTGKFPDNQLYHDLWNDKDGCHYDHEHGDSPYLANKYFGEPGALWGGQTIAYPFTSSPKENALKHNGFLWFVRTPEYHPWPQCGSSEQNDLLINRSDFCVVAVRAQVHISVAMDMFVRYHSGFLEVYACRPPYRAPQDCGVFKMGSSLVDWGQPRAPFYQTFRPRPFPGYNQPTYTVDFGDGFGGGMTMTGLLTDSINYPDLPGKSGEPYINVQPESPANLAFYRSLVPANGQQIFTEFWSSNDYDCEPRPLGDPCHNSFFHLAVTVMDSWFLLDTQDMRSVDFICQPGLPCHYNGSLRGLNEAGIRVLPEWDSKDGVTDGFVTWRGYTDRFGNPREGCTTAGSDCVPFEMTHAPVGVGQKNSGIDCLCVVWEYDTYFNGQPSEWIQFHNHTSHAPMSTSTPTKIAELTATGSLTSTATLLSMSTVTSISTLTSVPWTMTPTSTVPVLLSPTITVTGISTQKPPNSQDGRRILLPNSIKTDIGLSTGAIENLGKRDQNGTEDDPNHYVLFMEKKSRYKGNQSFRLPLGINRSSISEISLNINFKSSDSNYQKWTWSIFDWSKKRWVLLYEAKGVSSWKNHTLQIRNPTRFISGDGEIIIQLQSNKKNGEIKVDYEVLDIKIGYPLPTMQVVSVTSTPTQVLLTPLPSPTPTITATATVLTPTSQPTHDHSVSPTANP